MTLGMRWRVALTEARLRLAARRTADALPVVVACTHRTSSSSTYEALRRSLGLRVVKCHRLNPELMSWHRARGIVAGSHGLLMNRMHGDFAVHRSIVAAKRPARFVMVVRDPIAVMVSLAGLARSAPVPWGPSPEAAPIWPACAPFDVAMTEWFDGDVRPALGWSALDQPFDPVRGAGAYGHGPWKILVLRADLPDERKGEELSAFLGCRGITLRRINSAAERGQSSGVMQATHAIARMPGAIDRIYAHPFSRHFFAAAEIEHLRERWLSAG